MELTKETLKDFIKEGLTVVEFYKKEGCPNCEQMKPVMVQFEKDNPNIKVGYLGCVDGKDVPEGFQFGVFPGIFSFSEGRPVRGYAGVKSLQQLSLLFAHPNELKIAAYDAQATADFYKKEVSEYNRGVSAPQPEPPKVESVKQPDIMPPVGDPNEEACDSCV